MATTTDLKNFYKAMKELLKCPICLDNLQGPVFECRRGHPICLSCKCRLAQCATCKAEFNSNRTTILSQIVEVLPLACTYTGCNVFSIPSKFHSRYCTYRPTKCLCCNATVTLSDLCDHYQETHPRRCIFKTGSNPGTWPKILLKESNNVISLFYFFGQFFWRKMAVDYENKLFTVTFGCVPTTAVKGKFWAHISFIRDHYQVIQASPIPVLYEDQSLDSVDQCLVMGVHQLPPFVENGNLKFYKMDIKHID